jgi:Helix-turn-helix domain
LRAPYVARTIQPMPGTRAQTRLTHILDQRGIRYNWLAQKLGVRPWTFSRIEKGVQPAPADWYERAAAVLGVSPDLIAPLDDHDQAAA